MLGKKLQEATYEKKAQKFLGKLKKKKKIRITTDIRTMKGSSIVKSEIIIAEQCPLKRLFV